MSTTMKVSDFFSRLAATLKSCVKIAVQSRPVSKIPSCCKGGDRLVVLGNGPSLRKTIEECGSKLREMPTMAVNFMANAPEFAAIRPDYYVLADPHFFHGIENDNVALLWKNLANVDWPMTLCVPARMRKTARRFLSQNGSGTTNVPDIATFNFVGIEGFGWFERLAYRWRLGMPRPRNVLIPSIMTAINAGFKEILIAGADHSWLETIRVTDDNHVVSVQPHFYTDSKKELVRSEKEYQGYHLHDILYSFYTAFRSYHIIQAYAQSRDVKILNITPGSYIDAFPRSTI